MSLTVIQKANKKAQLLSQVKVTIERPEVSSWHRLKSIRLKAIQDSPDAFVPTLEQELACPPRLYKSFMRKFAVFIATVNGEDIGLIVAAGYDNWRNRRRKKDEKPQVFRGPLVAGAFSLWIDPRYRGGEIGVMMLKTCIDWAKNQATFSRISVDIAVHNKAAMNLATMLGFKKKGEAILLPHPKNSYIHEFELII